MAGPPPNLHNMDPRSACIQGVLKVKVKVKGHVIRALSWILGMSDSVIDSLVCSMPVFTVVLVDFSLSTNKINVNYCCQMLTEQVCRQMSCACVYKL